MTQLTPAQLTLQTTLADGDLLTGYPSGGPMYAVTVANTRLNMQTGTLLLNGTTTMTGVIKAANGSQANPSITFGSDTGTGMYRVSASKVGIAAGGVVLLTVDASGGIAAQAATPFVGNLTGNADTATGWATGRTLSITGDLAYTSPAIDGTANGSAAGTLATVNSNVGQFGSATKVARVTVNAKGLVTAVDEQTITAVPNAAGYNAQSTNYTLVLADAGKIIQLTSGAQLTIPLNASVAFVGGTMIWVQVVGAGASAVVSSATVSWFSGSAVSTGSRSVAQGGWFLLQKLVTGGDGWVMTGQGIT